jgi:hypothetical protein
VVHATASEHHLEAIDRPIYAQSVYPPHIAPASISVFVLSDDDLVVTGLTSVPHVKSPKVMTSEPLLPPRGFMPRSLVSLLVAIRCWVAPCANMSAAHLSRCPS